MSFEQSCSRVLCPVSRDSCCPAVVLSKMCFEVQADVTAGALHCQRLAPSTNATSIVLKQYI